MTRLCILALVSHGCTWIPEDSGIRKPDASDACTSRAWYADGDGDGVGGAVTSEACAAPSGYVATAGDCDDTDAAVLPGASERCNGLDDDCDLQADEGLATTLWYPDDDGDGHGDAAGAVDACAAPPGTVAEAGDCDDAAADVYPDAPEAACDALDSNCDGATGLDDRDADGAVACEDCDDLDASRAPSAAERCDGVDQDCDGAVDDDATDAANWYTDLDGDGFGDSATISLACDAPAGTVADDTDCDDTDANISPGGTETCAAGDEDCDGIEGEAASDAPTWYLDGDRDGYGEAGTVEAACEAPAGHVADGTDCDDGDAAIHPGAVESDCADPIDYDCDGVTLFADDDADGFAACLECDDGDGSVSPIADERCDGQDDDCDGEVDEEAIDAEIWYQDGDGDGFGDAGDGLVACGQPVGRVDDATDCDDANAGVSPAAVEACDGVDQDCDGEVDDLPECEADADGDELPDWQEAAGGTDPSDSDSDDDGLADGGELEWETDPLDADSDEDGLLDGDEVTLELDPNEGDSDGDGIEDGEEIGPEYAWYADEDGDGFGDPDIVLLRVTAPEGYVQDATDCDDGDAAASPAGVEVCDGIDQDCDGAADDGAVDAGTWYADVDGDGVGDAAVSAASCDAPAGYVSAGGDCNDASPEINPSMPEVCDAADQDEDCDALANDDDSSVQGRDTFYRDSDGDGYGDPTVSLTVCDEPMGYAPTGDDPDDTNATEPNPFSHPVTTLNGDGYWNCTQGSVGPGSSSGSYKTIAAWIQLAEGDTGGALIDVDPGGHGNGVESGFYVELIPQQVFWYRSESDQYGFGVSADTPILASDGTLHLVEVSCYDTFSGSVTFWVDGVLQQEITGLYYCNGNNHGYDFQIGAHLSAEGSVSGLFSGTIAEIGVWYDRPTLDPTPGTSLDPTNALVVLSPDSNGDLTDGTGNDNICSWVDLP